VRGKKTPVGKPRHRGGCVRQKKDAHSQKGRQSEKKTKKKKRTGDTKKEKRKASESIRESELLNGSSDLIKK